MIGSSILRPLLALSALSAATGCGPTESCDCGGQDVNASVWAAADGSLLIAGYTGLDRGFVKAASGSSFAVREVFDLPLWRGWGSTAASSRSRW